ncbi:MAG: helix-turn-helix domain containing protein [Clostridiales bacterium]|nr:helix-turn-helix domain containing protein [Clostridiales bacterium]
MTGTYQSINGLNMFAGFIQPNSYVKNNIAMCFDGFVQVVCKKIKAGFNDLKTVFWCRASELADRLTDIKIYPCNDYYITPNSFKKLEHRTNELFSYNNLVIDVDCHNKDISSETIAALADDFEYFIANYCDEYNIAMPNLCVKTGRGLQLWWSINPIYEKGRRKVIRLLVNWLQSGLKRIIEENKKFEVFTVDRAANNNVGGYKRLPMSWNTKAKRIVTYSVLNLNKYDFDDLCSYVFSERTETDNKKLYRFSCAANIDITRSSSRLFEKRMQQLYDFAKIRNYELYGLRNNFFLIMYSTLRIKYSHQKSRKIVKEFNDRLSTPMTDADLRSTLSTVSKRSEVYKFRNSTIIEMLGITNREKEELNMSSVEEQNRIRKMERVELMKKYLSKGLPVKKVAEKVGVSYRTVTRFTAKHPEYKKGNILESRVKELDGNMSTKEKAEALNVSKYQIRSAEKRIAQREAMAEQAVCPR